MHDDIPSELEPERSTGALIIGAWEQALAASGVERFVLVSLVAMMTTPFLPLWAALIGLEAIGLYDVDDGFSPP